AEARARLASRPLPRLARLGLDSVELIGVLFWIL
ncbi:MAG: hypothetical protein ACJAZF_005130, partial [Granulosicoccus sp.]